MSAILSFLGGSAFRAIWGEVSAWFTKRQDAKLELARMKVQSEVDAANHARQMESIKLQHTMGVEVIRVKADATLDEIDAQTFREASARAMEPSGIRWVDAWNGCIRPAFGTLALFLVLRLCHHYGWDMTAAAGVAEVVYSIIGFYFADRTLRKAGK
jgi:hypothetical protein